MANPILNDNFGTTQSTDRVIVGETMSVSGTIDKTFLMFLCAMIPAAYTWNQFTLGFTDKVSMLMMIGLIAGFIFAMVSAFTRNKIFMTLYAVCEGLFLGGISNGRNS